MHYPYRECIPSPTDLILVVNVRIVFVLTLAGDVYEKKCQNFSQMRRG